MGNDRMWISLVVSKETKRRLDFLRKLWGENRSQVVRRCVDEAYNTDAPSTVEPPKKEKVEGDKN